MDKKTFDMAHDALDDIEESAAEGYQLEKLGKYNKNSKEDKAVRKIDVLNKQLKRGAITKDEFNKLADAIIKKDGTKAWRIGVKPWQWLDKEGSQKISKKLVQRPNKTRSKETKKDFFGYNDVSIDGKNISANTMEKINRHLAFMRSSDNDTDYQNHRKALIKLLGRKDTNRVLQIDRNGIGTNSISGNLIPDKKTPVKANDKKNPFIHTSPVAGIRKLTPTNRSHDDVFYPDKRVYFSTKKAMAHNGLGVDKLNKYVYTGKKRANANRDPEMGGSAAYISTKYGLPVKKQK